MNTPTMLAAEIPMMLLSEDKSLYKSTYNGKRYIHIRRYFETNGQLIPKKEGVALHVDEWLNFLCVMDEINAEKREKTWNLSPRAFAWRRTDSMIQFGVRAQIWEGQDNAADAPTVSLKTIDLHPREWQTLVVKARDLLH